MNAGKRVRFYTEADLVHQLLEAKDARAVLKLQHNLSKIDLLILNELGMTDCKQDHGNLLFQVISSRYERCSTIITTNLEFKEWTSIFGTQQLTNALLDRLTHRCHIIPMNGESYSLKENLKRQKRSTAGKFTKVKEHANGK